MANEVVVTLRIDGTSGDPELEKALAEVMLEYFELWKMKQRSYGPKNIADFGAAGCVIRANDKVQRLRRHYFLNKDVDLPNEPLADAWLDLAGYGLIGLLCKRGLWPGVEIQ